MTAWTLSDQLNRAVKMALDSGEVGSIEAALALFSTYRLAVGVGADVARSPSLQAVVLTIVNTARRSFLGGVDVFGELDVELLTHWSGSRTLADALVSLGARIVSECPGDVPLVIVGDVGGVGHRGDFVVRATFDGWSAAVIPADDGERLAEAEEFVPAGVLAGSIAVSEAFQYVRGSNPLAGRRSQGLSLWCPGVKNAWRTAAGNGPRLDRLPSDLWLIGLGHLGQAFLWTLGLLPYAEPEAVRLFLQDFDTLVPANESTSPLTFASMIGHKKARDMASWCERRGFRTVITERHFGDDFKVRNHEPQVALCGVDNALARAALEDVGFARVIEAGLGKGGTEYLAFQIHGFPGPQTARKRWGRAGADEEMPELTAKPAYAALAEEGIDQCGLTTLAGRSVGAAFVGTAVSALVVAELLRHLAGAVPMGLVDGTMRNLDGLRAFSSPLAAEPFNPGSTLSLARAG